MANFDLFWRPVSSTSSKDEVDLLVLHPEEVDTEVEALRKTVNNAEFVFYDNKNFTKTQDQEQLENLLSNLLKLGVLLASAVVLFGGIIYLVHQWDQPVTYRFFRGEPSQFCSPIAVVKAVLAGSDRAIIQLGLLLLVATPILRVIISLLAFLWVRNFIYVMITLLVLSCLSYSLVGAYI
ncbi:DUF1634 domain-containing protein [Aetokthonos hydrillicola Thurmond2011]|jgi:uncharacterized membrane protein|uniref:DUF1634 domain-containing protein n=1 Tax=Aetokthonos hydrillicola Thurmond2011 TaxID=2712845 RepID=A0AAP5I1M9_9CYAN|nr:DUF1634 domain-containing protein [Aetokthonos hydrillicola]MBO3460470.1 DUF1634 domain-containing protein [Aetokthonos hydrillicola CCALA 1050]MBW4588242.1 DUF1634 domain-containing protein [Aetokthonos hydrillicola CCALA 1050]MDR9893071.1 DUF1634 domain-containing protein [Aetokthonos hydrillicola Thurmond2011]